MHIAHKAIFFIQYLFWVYNYKISHLFPFDKKINGIIHFSFHLKNSHSALKTTLSYQCLYIPSILPVQKCLVAIYQRVHRRH